jgi:hypothetical protein
MDKSVPPPLMARMRNEQTNLFKFITRITVIRDTSFSESGYVAIKAITIFFIIALMVLKVEPFAQGFFFVFLYSFILFAIILLIKDMDNPFEYQKDEPVIDEINFDILYEFSDRVRGKIGKIERTESQSNTDPALTSN